MTHNGLHYEFGPYQLDPSKRILTRNGEGIPLTPKATEILLVLVKHAGQLVEKDELPRKVQPDTFVEAQNIFTLRCALADDRTGPKYIDTVARCWFAVITLARLYLETKQFALAEEAIEHAVKTLELTDGAGRALLIMFEEMNDGLGQNEKSQRS